MSNDSSAYIEYHKDKSGQYSCKKCDDIYYPYYNAPKSVRDKKVVLESYSEGFPQISAAIRGSCWGCNTGNRQNQCVGDGCTERQAYYSGN